MLKAPNDSTGRISTPPLKVQQKRLARHLALGEGNLDGSMSRWNEDGREMAPNENTSRVCEFIELK